MASAIASTSRVSSLPCSCSYFTAPAARLPAVRRRRLAVRAQDSSPPPPTQQQQDDERRLEALEAAARARKGVKAEQADAFRPNRPARDKAAPSAGMGGFSEWKEGEMFPEGWEEMNPLQKANELYMGKRGFLFWATEAAKYSVGGLMLGWILFRFVGPALGLYRLTNDLSTPNLL